MSYRFKYKFLLPTYWLYWLGLAVFFLYTLLPAFIKEKIVKFIAKYQYNKKSKRYYIIKKNILTCFNNLTETQQEKIIQDYYYYAIKTYLDLPLIWWGSKKKIKKNINIIGLEKINRLKKENKNIILLTCHSLALEFGPVALSCNDKIVSLANTFRSGFLDWLVNRGRTRFGMGIFSRAQGIRHIIKEMKNKKMFVYVTDEDNGKTKTIFAPFFGTEKATIPALQTLIKITDACVLPLWSYYKNGKYQAVIWDRVNFDTTDKTKLATQMNRVFEKMIKTAPAQYMWNMRLFKTRPEGKYDKNGQKIKFYPNDR
jgi:Kdo2-lipid IVA lauroyltransferase/acyltransferase